ncbi:MAG: putative sporulation protein YtxC [Clostridia bacterium]|nr:putative sporulation protein YtxC [Clostridia bacterium]
MISICLKSNNISSLKSIENYLDNTTFPEIYYSQKKFKYFDNLIIHYKGYNEKSFYKIFSNILSNYIIDYCEKRYIQQQLTFEFFYFTLQEKKKIQETALKTMSLESNVEKKVNILQKSITDYFSTNSSCNLDGFINFRLYDYKNFINLILESIINDYVLQKEYAEYVSLLQEYISIQNPQSECIHLIYSNDTKILLDNSKNIIANTTNPQIYLSDISFSSNDFILNSLLSLLPSKIFIHLGCDEDNFIKFLKLIFKDRFIICNDCNICSLYFSNLQRRCKRLDLQILIIIGQERVSRWYGHFPAHFKAISKNLFFYLKPTYQIINIFIAHRIQYLLSLFTSDSTCTISNNIFILITYYFWNFFFYIT